MITNKYNILCPLAIRSFDYDENDSELLTVNPCHEPLYLTYATSYGLSPEDLGPIYPEHSHTRSWQIECGSGHVLMVSDSQDEDGRFQAFDMAELRKLLDRIEDVDAQQAT